MKSFNIYMTGVGGQGIGLLSEVLSKAFFKLGKNVKAVDTHGLAQRGGTVISQLRAGEIIFSPLISPHEADLVLSLERLETLRGIADMLKNGGKAIYYDAAFQTIDNRLGNDTYPTVTDLESVASKKDIKIIRVFRENLHDSRMQNIILLKELAHSDWIEGFTIELIDNILKEILSPKVYEKNEKLLKD
ncbi:MAG: 2-oxoacid:acceptor oxidoreductase family protein [Candidatus Marinimicrobia bacterium]|nr:2-oxoacid:acceptor oxidoreductase family protein [Candidatus Neomarinimicrobiota bacterium]